MRRSREGGRRQRRRRSSPWVIVARRAVTADELSDRFGNARFGSAEWPRSTQPSPQGSALQLQRPRLDLRESGMLLTPSTRPTDERAAAIASSTARGDLDMHRCLPVLLSSLIALVLAGPVLAQAPAQAPIVLKAGTAVGPASPLNETMGILDKSLQEKTKGRLKIELHNNNSLAKCEGTNPDGDKLGTIYLVALHRESH